jgi:TPR repeat protein
MASDAPVSTHEPPALVCPSNEELRAELHELRTIKPEAGIKWLRNMLKENHPLWLVSENRVRQALSDAPKATSSEKQQSFVEKDSYHQVNGRVQLPEGTDPAGFFAFISKQAATGDAIAQYNMYVFYSRGIPGGVRKNEKMADQWLVRAGMNPDAPREALTDYGLSLKCGSSHIQQDLVRAVQIFERATHLGDSLATFHLAQMLNDGAGVPNSQPERALQLWKLVADGNREPIAPSVQPTLEGCEIPEAMYEYGSRCKDPKEKRHYLKMAAKTNLAKAQYELFCVLLQGPENVEVSQERRAAKWYRAAKRQGFVEKTPVIIDRIEDLCLEVVIQARMLQGGIDLRSMHLRKARAKKLAASPLLSELEDDDED